MTISITFHMHPFSQHFLILTLFFLVFRYKGSHEEHTLMHSYYHHPLCPYNQCSRKKGITVIWNVRVHSHHMQIPQRLHNRLRWRRRRQNIEHKGLPERRRSSQPILIRRRSSALCPRRKMAHWKFQPLKPFHFVSSQRRYSSRCSRLRRIPSSKSFAFLRKRTWRRRWKIR